VKSYSARDKKKKHKITFKSELRAVT